MTIVHNVEGVNPAIPIPPGVKFVTPKYRITNDTSLELEQLEAFLNLHSNVIYLSFGDSKLIPADLIENMEDYIYSQEEYALIINVVNEKELDHKLLLKAKNSKNIMIISTICDSMILSYEHVRLYVTNGDKQSVLSSYENAKPLIILPYSHHINVHFCQHV